MLFTLLFFYCFVYIIRFYFKIPIVWAAKIGKFWEEVGILLFSHQTPN